MENNNLLEPILDLIWEPEEVEDIVLNSIPPGGQMWINCVCLCGGGKGQLPLFHTPNCAPFGVGVCPN